MLYAFLLGILVALAPSVLAVAWVVWRAEAADKVFRDRPYLVDATSRSRAKSPPTKNAGSTGGCRLVSSD
jgi:hypothetical protein